MNLAQVLFTVNVSKLPNNKHTKRSRRVLCVGIEVCNKEEEATQNLHTSSQCLTAIYLYVSPIIYMYIYNIYACGEWFNEH